MITNKDIHGSIFDYSFKVTKRGILFSIVVICVMLIIALLKGLFGNNETVSVYAWEDAAPFCNIILCLAVIFLCIYIGIKIGEDNSSDKGYGKKTTEVLGYLFNKEYYAVKINDGNIVIPYILVHIKQCNQEKWLATDQKLDQYKGNIEFLTDYELKKIQSKKDITVLIDSFARQKDISRVESAKYICSIMRQTHPHDSFKFQTQLDEIITSKNKHK